MSLKGNYFTGNLACQNLGDCSLCEIPIMPEIKTEQAKTEQAKKEKDNLKRNVSVKKILQKVSAVLSASVLLSIMYKGL